MEGSAARTGIEKREREEEGRGGKDARLPARCPSDADADGRWGGMRIRRALPVHLAAAAAAAAESVRVSRAVQLHSVALIAPSRWQCCCCRCCCLSWAEHRECTPSVRQTASGWGADDRLLSVRCGLPLLLSPHRCAWSLLLVASLLLPSLLASVLSDFKKLLVGDGQAETVQQQAEGGASQREKKQKQTAVPVHQTTRTRRTSQTRWKSGLDSKRTE